MKNALSLSTFAEYDELAADELHDVHVSIHLEARDDAESSENRPDMSILFVLDVSSSMAGEPLAQVLKVVDTTVGMLRATDRVGVMTFAKRVQEVIEVRDADAEHLRRLRRRVRAIKHRCWTNFEAALNAVPAAMPARREGERQVVIFLSDGHPSVGERGAAGLAKLVHGWESIALSTLGFGHHHDPDMLELMSVSGGGQYHFIADPLVCEYEFTSALGAQQSVVATDVEVIIEPAPGCEVAAVLGVRSPLELNDFGAGTQRFFVAHIKVKANLREKSPQTLASIALRYHDEVRQKGEEIIDEVSVTLANESGAPNHKVIADQLVAGAEDVRRKARRMVRIGRKEGAAFWLAEMIENIEKSPVYTAGDETLLGGVCEDLREEREILLENSTKEHKDYTLNNSRATTIRPGRAHRRVPRAAESDGAVVRLQFESGPRAGEDVRIHGVVVIGRSSVVDIVLDDEAVSRRHAQFLVYDGQQIIRDLGSQNGTFVNGNRVWTSRTLVHNDFVRLGDVVARVLVE